MQTSDKNLDIKEQLKSNNAIILSQIHLIEQAIINKRNMSQNNTEPKAESMDDLEVFYEGKLTNISKTLLTLYMNNCLNIYKYEFPNLVKSTDENGNTIYDKSQRLNNATVTKTSNFDCYGLPSGVQVSNSAQEVFNIIAFDTPEKDFKHPFVNVMSQLGYKNEDGKIHFVHGRDKGIQTRGEFGAAVLGGNENQARLFDQETEFMENSLNYNDF